MHVQVETAAAPGTSDPTQARPGPGSARGRYCGLAALCVADAAADSEETSGAAQRPAAPTKIMRETEAGSESLLPVATQREDARPGSARSQYCGLAGLCYADTQADPGSDPAQTDTTALGGGAVSEEVRGRAAAYAPQVHANRFLTRVNRPSSAPSHLATILNPGRTATDTAEIEAGCQTRRQVQQEGVLERAERHSADR